MGYQELKIDEIFERILSTINAKNQSEIAKEFGMTRAAISKWRKGYINLNRINDFAKKKDISFLWLIEGDTDKIAIQEKMKYMKELIGQKNKGLINKNIFDRAMSELWSNA